METANPGQQQVAEPPHPYDKFRQARDGLMQDFLHGLGNIEAYLLEHDRVAERKLREVTRLNAEQSGEIIRLKAELQHRTVPVSWNVIDEHVQDLGEQRAIQGEIVPDQSEEIARLTGLLADQEGKLTAAEANVGRLEGELRDEKELTARLEGENRRLDEKIEEDRRDWAAQEARRREDAARSGEDSARELGEARTAIEDLKGEVGELNGKLAEANGLREQAAADAARAREELDAEKRRAAQAEENLGSEKTRADQAEQDLAAERDKPAPPPAEVDVAAVRATADEEAKDRVATIIMSIEEDNPGISLNNSLDLFATAWAAPRVREPEAGQDGNAPGDLFDFTMPPPAENEDIPYVPSTAAAEN